MFKRIGILATLAMLASCAEEKSSGSATKEVRSETTSVQEVIPKNVKFNLVRKAKADQDIYEYALNANIYQIEVSAQNTLKNISIECDKNVDSDFSESIQETIGQDVKNQKFEIELNQDDPFENILRCKAVYKQETLSRIEKPILKSVVAHAHEVYDAQKLVGVKRVQDIILLDNSIFLTNGQTIELKAEVIKSLNGQIKTFLPEDVNNVVANREGLNGGQIYLVVQKLEGDLKIKMTGTRAGEQVRVPEKITEVPAFDKKLNGNCVGFHENNDKRCFGKDGIKGFKGRKGYTGLSGGNSGQFDLEITEEKNGTIEVTLEAGQGGAGGIGGLGGEGTIGGKGSRIEWNDPRDHGYQGPGPRLKSISGSDHSHKFPDGKHGEEGDRGEVGEEGKAGVIEKSLIRLTKLNRTIEVNASGSF